MSQLGESVVTEKGKHNLQLLQIEKKKIALSAK